VARVTIDFARAGELPWLCVCCGRPAARVRQQQFRLDGARSAAVLVASVALGGLAWTERGVTLALPVCHDHRRRGRRSTRTLFWGMILTAALAVGAYLRSEFDGPGNNYLTAAALFTFVGTLVVGMHQADDGLKVRGLTRDSFSLTGVSREFGEALTGPVEGRRQVPFRSRNGSGTNPGPI
jgi:hypothetical protein